MFDKYDPDEALRISEVTAEFECETYVFRVHNSGGIFRVMLVRHEYDHDFLAKTAKHCKRAANDPCTVEDRDLKCAIRTSIAEHRKKFHSLSLAGK